MSFKHVVDSKEAKAFLKGCGIKMTKDSCHNTVVLKNEATGETLQLWAESDSGIAAGIPGIYVDVPK